MNEFGYKAPRAVKARLGKALVPWQVSFLAGFVLLFIGGAVLVIFGYPAGWALLGLSFIPFMISQWVAHELKIVPFGSGDSVVDKLESSVLALIPRQPTPKQLAQAVAQTTSGHFFAARFGIGGSFMEQLASENRDNTAGIWGKARQLAAQADGVITGGVLIAAMVEQLPGKATLLGHLQLTEEDLLRGITWYASLRQITEQPPRQKRPGGIGRDWSFGWIPTLSRFGVNISEHVGASEPPVRSELVEHLESALGSGRGSLALVGRPGVGKTELVYELAERLMDAQSGVSKSLLYRQVFMLDASRLLSASKEKGVLEQLLNRVLSEAFEAKNIIICLDNAHLFFEDAVGSVDISNLLLPILEAGRLPIILTIDEQKYLEISRRSPAIANAMTKINVAPSDEAQTMSVLLQHVPRLEYKRKVTYMYQALKEAYTLGARYVYNTSMPGQAMSVLDAAADRAEQGLVTVASVAAVIEERTGVKTGSASSHDERETLLNLESLIHERMIGQERAVSVVSDALRRARAGVRNQKRPVGTFLFLGPTGVGKTELAKTLSSVYFGGEESVIRLDMNEFVSPDDVARLISDDAGSLTNQVMKRPFSVVLLDEIEKAHSSVLSTLLQLLDEGILRDVRGREISFRDTIVIATSNAGADRIQEYLHRGYSLLQFEETFINELISSHLFHPEFLNRFDEMVVFGPLSQPELLKVVDLIIAGVNKNLSGQNISVEVEQDAKEYLVEAGYDPRLGARPMRRVVQKAVESNVAKLLLAGEVQPGSTITITRELVEGVLGRERQADDIIAGA